MQHRHMDTNYTYKYTIRWLTKKNNIHVHVKTNRKKHYMYRHSYWEPYVIWRYVYWHMTFLCYLMHVSHLRRTSLIDCLWRCTLQSKYNVCSILYLNISRTMNIFSYQDYLSTGVIGPLPQIQQFMFVEP